MTSFLSSSLFLLVLWSSSSWSSSLFSVTSFVMVVGRPVHSRSKTYQRTTLTSTTIFQTSSMIDDDDEEEEEERIVHARTLPVQVVRAMPPPLPLPTKNQYYFLRHGQSTANVASIISSDRSTLAYTDKHGLTDLGYEQGVESARQLLDRLEEVQHGSGERDKRESSDTTATTTSRVIFLSSPFARARQTAEACLDGLADPAHRARIESMGLNISHDVVMEHGLMERYFGKLDGEAIYTYAYVWPVDKMNVTHTAFDVESVAAVCTRLSEVMDRCESNYDGCHIVWVSHADVLQIGQLYAAGSKNVGEFSSYRFKNGEVRAMKRCTEYLPEPAPLEAPDRRLKTSL